MMIACQLGNYYIVLRLLDEPTLDVNAVDNVSISLKLLILLLVKNCVNRILISVFGQHVHICFPIVFPHDCTPTFPLISYSVLMVPVDFGHFKY